MVVSEKKPPEVPDAPIAADDVPRGLVERIQRQMDGPHELRMMGMADPRAASVVYGINVAKIGDYCTALEDGNPVYWDAEFAKKTRFGGIISPWGTMSQSGGAPMWTPHWMPGRSEYSLRLGIGKADLPDEQNDHMYFRPFVEAGLDEVIDAGGEVYYYRPLRLGDVPIKGKSWLWGLKRWPGLRLGEGYVFYTGTEIFNQKGDKVGFHGFRQLRYKKRPREDSTGYARRREATVNMKVGQSTTDPFITRRWDDVQVGEDLPAFAIEWHWHRMLWACAATGDYYPWHSDPEYARDGGKRDMFLMHTPSEGLYCRLMTDWGGPEAEPRHLKYDILRSICTGDTTITGARVVGKREAVNLETGDLEALVDLRMEIWNTVEDSLSGQAEATLRLPRMK